MGSEEKNGVRSCNITHNWGQVLSKDPPLAENIIIIPFNGRIKRYEAHAVDQVGI